MTQSPTDAAPGHALPTGHPKGLYVLFMAEMWERFCYYGMRVLLTLYLIKSLAKGDNEAFAIYAAYTALVYAAPVLGGKIADTILGYRLAVILGGVLMAIGEFMILGGTDHWLYLGMGAIIVGNGYFKANISSIVGKLYADGDPRRDSGFTIFYIGINIGALLSTLICAEVGDKFGFEYGFALAGIGMILGLFFFVGGQASFRHVAEPPHPEKLHKPFLGPLSQFHTVVLGSLLVIPLLYFLILYNDVVGYLLTLTGLYVVGSLIARGAASDKRSSSLVWTWAGLTASFVVLTGVLSLFKWTNEPLLDMMIGGELVSFTVLEALRIGLNAISVLFLIYVVIRLYSGSFLGDGVLRDRLFMLIILMVFNVVFWACFEQAGTSLTLFAERNVDRNVGGFEMGAATTQFFNPLFIILFGSVFSVLWVYLNRVKRNPSIPMKFGLGIIQLGLGYLVVLVGSAFASPEFLVPLWTLVFLYLLHTTGELFLSPIGLSMVTKLVPKDMTGTAMGAWFLSFSASNFVAGIIAKLTGAEEGADGVAATAQETLASYVDVYSTMGYVTVGIGLLLVLLSPLLNRLMHGIR